MLAKVYAARGNPAEAIAQLKKTIDTNPKNQAAYLSLGHLYQQNGQVQSAIDTFEKALEIFPEFWIASNNLAFLLAEHGNTTHDQDRAYQYALQAQARQPNHPAVMDTLGWIYHHRGELYRAMVLLEKANAVSPEDPVINYHFGKVLYELGMLQEARQKLEKALESGDFFEGQEDARNTLAEIS